MTEACGECSLCSVVFGIPEADIGARFKCEWLADPASYGPKFRPSVANFTMAQWSSDRPGGGVTLLARSHPDHPDAWRREPYRRILQAAAAQGCAMDPPVTVVADRKWLIPPDEEFDMNIIRSAEDIARVILIMTTLRAFARAEPNLRH